MIIDGRAIAREILAQVKKDTASLGRPIVVRAVVVKPSPATESYLSIKVARAHEAGMEMDIVRLRDRAETPEVIEAVQQEGADAVIVQLPLPENITTTAVLDSIPLHKDADVLSSSAYHMFQQGNADALVPPVALALGEILSRSGVDPQGKRIIIIGNGRLVGEPASYLLSRFSDQVTVFTRESGNLLDLKDADIIVSGAGQAGLITPDLIKPGVVLIDAGTSESNGAIAGDAIAECAEVASVFTPVPGGVGPIAVACLFKNVSLLATDLA